MRTAGSRWTVALEQSEEIDFALYVRDVLGIRGVRDHHLPPVVPAPTRRPAAADSGADDDAAAETWTSWWSHLMRRRSGHAADAQDRPAPDFTLGLRNGFAEWREERNRRDAQDVPTRELLSDLPSIVAKGGELRGRPNLDLALVLTEVPVAAPVWIEISSDHILVSRAALQDPEGVRRRILAIIQRL